MVHISSFMTEFQPFNALTPDLVLTAVESAGLPCDGRMLALNSYENRVYQVGLEDAEPVVVKFYRPNRWSQAQIQEEHDFLDELAAGSGSVAKCGRPQYPAV